MEFEHILVGRARDLATVTIGGELRRGAASHDGHEAVVGSALMLVGANSRTVAKAVGDKLQEISSTLPTDIVLVPLLDRSQLVIATISTVGRNLGEGALLVIAVLFFILGNWRAAVIATLVIPLSMLMSAIGMNVMNISGNLMSLGALDFGLIIDGAVIIVENNLRRHAERQSREGRQLNKDERLAEVVQSSQEMVRPTVYGQIIIFLVFLPCLTFQGVEGKMFSPMVITLMLALASAFALSLTFVPAMVALLLTGHVNEEEVKFIRKAKTLYEPWLHRAIARPWPFIGGAVAIFALALAIFLFIGREFMPTLDEQNLNLSSVRIPSTSIDQSLAIDLPLERNVLALPEVLTSYSKAGTASLAADPMPPNASDNYIILKPKDQWPAGVTTKDQVIERIRAKTEHMVGNNYDVTQPIEMRFNELIGGVRSDVAVKVYGENLNQLNSSARQIAAVLQKIPGAADVRVAQTRGFPTFDIQFDRDAISRYGLTMQDVADTVSTALGGKQAGQVFEGDVLGPMLDRMAALRAAKSSKRLMAGTRLYGRATTVGTWFIFVGPSAATINLNADGSATLVTSGVEIGSGSMMQALPQIVANVLGLRPEDVIVRAADTDAGGYDVGVGGGRTTVSLGAASMAACVEVRRKLLEVASEMLEAAPDDLVLANGRVEIVGIKGSGATIAEVAERAQRVVGPISGSGSFTGPGVAAMPGCATGHFI